MHAGRKGLRDAAGLASGHFVKQRPGLSNVHQNRMILLLAQALGAFLLATSASAATSGYRVLHAFGSAAVSAGEHPTDELVSDSAGNLYGTTQEGGSGGLVIDPRDNLFGTTLVGGASDCGTVYRVSRLGVETQVYAFGGTQASGGCLPTSALALDSAGHVYGATLSGGARGRGTVYQLTPGTASSPTRYTVLHRFLGGADGNVPLGGVVLDAAQKQLYGTPRSGGSDDMGTVFTLDPSSGAESVLHRFAGPAAGDGEDPAGGVLIDTAGELAGTTRAGEAAGARTATPDEDKP